MNSCINTMCMYKHIKVWSTQISGVSMWFCVCEVVCGRWELAAAKQRGRNTESANQEYRTLCPNLLPFPTQICTHTRLWPIPLTLNSPGTCPNLSWPRPQLRLKQLSLSNGRLWGHFQIQSPQSQSSCSPQPPPVPGYDEAQAWNSVSTFWGDRACFLPHKHSWRRALA